MPTIKQKTVVVDIEGGKRIEVRRMRWKAAREFYRKIGALLATVYRDAPLESSEERKPGQFAKLMFAKLPDVISSSDELVTHLCTQSTDLSTDEFDNLDNLSALAVLDAALSVNCDDEIKNSFAGIGQKVAGLLPAKTTTS